MGGGRLHVDFEGRSECDLRTLGSTIYAQHPTTTPTMLAFGRTANTVQVRDFYCPVVRNIVPVRCPSEILQAIEDDDTFVAHNARFEQDLWYWKCHLQWGWPMPRRWSCTAARARYWGIRASLEGAASDLELVDQKDEFGKLFIDAFCKPREYKGAKHLGVIKTHWMDPGDTRLQPMRVKGHLNELVVPAEMWAKGKEYCKQDVRSEIGIDEVLPELPDFEQRVWELDFRINTRGLPIDIPVVKNAIQFSDHYTAENIAKFEAITNLRPTQRDKVLEYLNQREEIDELGDLRSKTMQRIVQDDLPQDLQDVINIRLETSKASIKKLEKMVVCTSADGRARSTLVYGGAHTMRWSAKRIQVHNMTRPDMKVYKAVFDYLEGPWFGSGMVGHNGGPPMDEMPQMPAWVFEAGLRFARPLGALSKAMRGFIKATEGHELICGDYAQIEARTLPWLARCTWLLEAFRRGDDVYTRFGAEHMFGKRYEDCIYIKDGKPKVQPWFELERQKAKSAQLGCGFQASGRGFQAYCDNVNLILSLEEANEIVKKYRNAHPEIADWNNGFWTRVERAAILAVTHEGDTVQLSGTGVSYHVHRIDAQRYWLICTLPSGRHIAYYRPKVRITQRGTRTKETLSFRTEWCGKSYREDTYGGKLTENIVQATARDVCCVGALNVDAAGYPVVGLVHDEVITEPEIGFGSPEHVTQLMCQLPPWITDCPVEADGARMIRYGK